ncbi:hypothetical protein ACFX2F_006836 [Malus domestica]
MLCYEPLYFLLDLPMVGQRSLQLPPVLTCRSLLLFDSSCSSVLQLWCTQFALCCLPLLLAGVANGT